VALFFIYGFVCAMKCKVFLLSRHLLISFTLSLLFYIPSHRYIPSLSLVGLQSTSLNHSHVVPAVVYTFLVLSSLSISYSLTHSTLPSLSSYFGIWRNGRGGRFNKFYPTLHFTFSNQNKRITFVRRSRYLFFLIKLGVLTFFYYYYLSIVILV